MLPAAGLSPRRSVLRNDEACPHHSLRTQAWKFYAQPLLRAWPMKTQLQPFLFRKLASAPTNASSSCDADSLRGTFHRLHYRGGRSREVTATNIADHGGSLQWRARGTRQTTGAQFHRWAVRATSAEDSARPCDFRGWTRVTLYRRLGSGTPRPCSDTSSIVPGRAPLIGCASTQPTQAAAA